ncbi:hypothetical protein BJY00DRAFT_312077 [Aspergillus carlsbadensis]|nr:hypothetical protein BJY00DRAFT_312077 [Aspergillus carlsbadensis]
MAGFASYHLQDLTFTGPQDSSSSSSSNSDSKIKPYASLAILDPIITIERRHGKYHIAARFNIETAILNYASQTKDGRDLFFQDICLMYKSTWDNETLVMKPESDSSAALTVSRGFTASTSATVGVLTSQTPSGNVSLGLTRSRSLTVEYAMTSWSLASHRVVSDEWPDTGEQVRYQWFWAGTQDDSGRLSSDLKHAVKRHVVVKRVVSEEMIAPLPNEGIDEAETSDGITEGSSRQDDEEEGEEEEGEEGEGEEGEGERGEESGTDGQERVDDVLDLDTIERENNTPIEIPVDNADPDAEARRKAKVVYTWDSLLDFRFSVQIRVKKRLSRLQRLALCTSNEVRGRYLRPVYIEDFRLRVPPLEDMIPKEDTVDISDMLSRIKKDFENKLDELPEKDFFEIASAHIRREAVRTTQEHRTQDQKAKQEWADRKFDIVRPAYSRRYMKQL